MKQEITDLNKLIVNANESVQQVEANIPTYNSSLTETKKIYKRIEDFIKNNISYTIDSIRYKIDHARSLANRVPVASNFNGSTSVSLSSPIAEGENTNEISMSVKTTEKDGLLMYIGDGLSSARRRRQSPGATSDMNYLSLVLENGFVVLIAKAGSIMARIVSSKAVSDGQWYSIKATR